MKCGCLMFAHDGTIDYGSQAVLAARLAKKHLDVPVSLVSDHDTISNIRKKFANLPFEHIIEIAKPSNNNIRFLGGETLEFLNTSRSSAYDLTPYDRTLLIDTDFLIFSNQLSKYWDVDKEFLITPGMLEITKDVNPCGYRVSPNTIEMLWATNIMFSKTPDVKMIFDLVDYIKEEYEYFSHLYEFDAVQFRNDYAFSIACHILSGHGCEPVHGTLPVPVFYIDKDRIVGIQSNDQITFLVDNNSKPIVSKCQGQDVHIMNKRDLLAHLDKLMELTNE